MDSLLAARWQMGVSLGFHIVFAVIGMAMPVMMVVAEALWLRTRDPTYLHLTKRWARGTAVFFAVGAVSGTVLSFELGLLWPRFMAFAGSIIGMPFSLEGFAFFIEAIFLGIYLFGWDRISPRAHLFAGMLVAISGAFSGMFVVTANAWMNTPAGFHTIGGRVADVDPIAAMLNPAAAAEVLHMLLAAYMAVGMAVAGVHARLLLAHPKSRFHQSALAVALSVGLAPAIAQPLSGDFAARMVARFQPAKLAAMEGQFASEAAAPLRIGGIPDANARITRGAIEVPGGLSLFAYGDSKATVTGLNDIARENWPPVLYVHLAFQVMVSIGMFLAVLASWGVWLWWRGRTFESRPFLRLLVVATPLGFVAIEAGWVVTELGRQPWIVQGIMRTSDAVTPMPGIAFPFAAVTLVYAGLAVFVTLLIRRQVGESELLKG